MLTFKTLDLADKDRIESFVNHFKPYSDFNFISLFSWSLHSQTKYCLTDSCLYVSMPDYINQKLFLSFLGNDPINDLDSAIDYCIANKIERKFLLLPEHTAKRIEEKYINNHDCKIVKDRDNFDYILDSHLISQSKGSQFEDFRYKISKLKRDYSDSIKIMDFNPKHKEDVRKIIELSHHWGIHKKSQGALYEDELYALSRFLKVASISSNLKYFALEKEGKCIAFVSYEILDNQFAMGHFLKYAPAYKGLYQLLIKLVCDDLAKNDIPFINIEQDLGIKSLRDAKMHLRPIKFLEKYTLELG
jgi:hypothetical protein